jgi:ribosome-associated protein
LTTKATQRSPEPVTRRLQPPNPATTEAALAIARHLDQKLAKDIVILDMSGPLVIADYFVVATVQSTRQAQALAKELDLENKANRGRRRRNTGGLETEESNWVLLDFDDVVVHLFLPEARQYYGLETLWADAPRLPFTPAPVRETVATELRQPTLEGFGALQPTDVPPRGE